MSCHPHLQIELCDYCRVDILKGKVHRAVPLRLQKRLQVCAPPSRLPRSPELPLKYFGVHPRATLLQPEKFFFLRFLWRALRKIWVRNEVLQPTLIIS